MRIMLQLPKQLRKGILWNFGILLGHLVLVSSLHERAFCRWDQRGFHWLRMWRNFLLWKFRDLWRMMAKVAPQRWNRPSKVQSRWGQIYPNTSSRCYKNPTTLGGAEGAGVDSKFACVSRILLTPRLQLKSPKIQQYERQSVSGQDSTFVKSTLLEGVATYTVSRFYPAQYPVIGSPWNFLWILGRKFKIGQMHIP